MKNDDQRRFVEALGGVALAVTFELTEKTIDVYSQLLLAEYTIEQLEAACFAFLREPGRRFFPTVAEFHQAISNPTRIAPWEVRKFLADTRDIRRDWSGALSEEGQLTRLNGLCVDRLGISWVKAGKILYAGDQEAQPCKSTST